MYPLFPYFKDGALAHYMQERAVYRSSINGWERLIFAKDEPDMLGQQPSLRVYTGPQKTFSVVLKVENNVISIRVQAIAPTAFLMPDLARKLNDLGRQRRKFLVRQSLPTLEELKKSEALEDNAFVLVQQGGVNTLYYANLDEQIYTPVVLNSSQETQEQVNILARTHNETFIDGLASKLDPRLNDQLQWSRVEKTPSQQSLSIDFSRSYAKLKTAVTALNLPPEIRSDIHQYIDQAQTELLKTRMNLVSKMKYTESKGLRARYDADLGKNAVVSDFDLPSIAHWCADKGEKEVALRLAMIVEENDLDTSERTENLYCRLLANDRGLLTSEEKRLTQILQEVLGASRGNPRALLQAIPEAQDLLSSLPAKSPGAALSVSGSAMVRSSQGSNTSNINIGDSDFNAFQQRIEEAAKARIGGGM